MYAIIGNEHHALRSSNSRIHRVASWFGIVSCALHISYRDITTSNTTNQGADEHVSHVNEITHVMTLKWLKAKYRQRLKQSKENPKHVKDLYYHLSHNESVTITHK